jgi:hypothetical protein
MSCDHPITAYQSAKRNENGKRPLVFDPIKGYGDTKIEIPCQKCTGCRLEKSKQWAIRCQHETQMHNENTYLTLTYETQPEGETLIPRDLQLFHKKLHNRLLRERKKGIRYFACGEYGDETNRPHYHTIIFGYDFKDKKFYKYNKAGHPLYTSATLEEIWGHGQCTIGAATFESCQYVAKYTLKKINGDKAPDHYQGRQPEFGRMSRRPGIGYEWYKEYGKDTYNHDNVISGGKPMKPPKYYDEKQKELDNKQMLKVKGKRARQARRKEIKNLDQRRRQRTITATVRDAKTNLYRREI